MSPSLRRLMKEASELSSSPSPHFHAHPVSDNLYDWHFTLSGPPSPSPYAQGIYHGRIIFPSTYPLRPPSFRFLTPSGRFEINREICLSISGHHEELWQPAWGIRTALIAIRSFMDADAKGQVGGLDVEDRVRREWALQSRRWRCEVCHGGGKTNEEILGEWREYCREKGVEEGDENETEPDGGIPDGSERKGKKNEGGFSLNQNVDVDNGKKETSTASTSSAAAAASSSSPSLPSLPTEPTAHTNTFFAPPPPPPQTSWESDATTTTRSSPSTSIQTYQNQTRNPNSNSSSNSSHHQLPQRRTQHTPTQPLQEQQQQSTEDPWLDRAILGVIVALAFMVFRRILNSLYDDYD